MKKIINIFKLNNYLKILFFKYLSYHSSISKMTAIKSTIMNEFKITEDQFDCLIWRANRVLIFRREYNLIEFQSNDKLNRICTYNNYFRQLGYFKGEINDINTINEDLFENDFINEIIEYLKDEKNELERVINVALYPNKNQLIEKNIRGNRYFNGGCYFIDD
jgi:hypothetical protein